MAHHSPGGLVLLVEDNRNISEPVGEFLESRGFEVDYAADGIDAYNLASENPFDVIVLDLMLPRLGGLEVCRRLRADGRNSTPILMLTARDSLEEKIEGLEAGADVEPLKEGDRLMITQSAVVLEKLIGQFLFDKTAEPAAPAVQ